MCNEHHACMEREWKELADGLECKLEETVASIGEMVECRRRGFITNDELVRELDDEVELAKALVKQIGIARRGIASMRSNG